jgi:hypothetical protein
MSDNMAGALKRLLQAVNDNVPWESLDPEVRKIIDAATTEAEQALSPESVQRLYLQPGDKVYFGEVELVVKYDEADDLHEFVLDQPSVEDIMFPNPNNTRQNLLVHWDNCSPYVNMPKE